MKRNVFNKVYLCDIAQMLSLLSESDKLNLVQNLITRVSDLEDLCSEIYSIYSLNGVSALTKQELVTERMKEVV